MLNDRRILWAGIANALVLFLGLVGIGIVDTDEPATSNVSSSGTPTTSIGGTSADPDATVSPTPGDPAAPASTTAPGGAPATTAKPGGAPAPAPAGTPAARPPADGVYRNRVETKGQGDEDTREVKTRVTTLSRTDSEVKQRAETEGDEGGGGFGGGFNGDQESSWRRDGVYVRSDFGGEEIEADCQPPEQIQMKLPLEKGVTWSNEVECTYTVTTPQGKATGRQKIRTTSTVTGSSTRAVAGKQFFVWEVVTDGTFEGTTSFGGQDYPNKGTSKTMTYFAPEIGVAPLTETTVTSEAMGQRGTATSTVTLLNHTPE